MAGVALVATPSRTARSGGGRVLETSNSGLANPSNPAAVTMVELVVHGHEGGACDVGLLLRAMDLATCAAAEKHSGVNCVTVAVGDVVIEHGPRVGDLLSLTAEPVLVGRTSIEVAVRATATRGPARRAVCDAHFTYARSRAEISRSRGRAAATRRPRSPVAASPRPAVRRRPGSHNCKV